MELINAETSNREDDFVSLSDYLGQPLILESLGRRKQQTARGEADVVAALLHTWDGSDLDFKGEVLVFWTKVQDKLESAKGAPVAGVLSKGARAYFLDPVDDATFKKMGAAFKRAEQAEKAQKF